MAKYAYAAVFSEDENGRFSVNFPDLEGCYTCGDDLKDTLTMAKDVLAYVLYDYEREGKKIPEPSNPEDIKFTNGEFMTFVACDTMDYRKMHNNRAVKKTLTIPGWLNEAALSMELNFSQVLQEALVERMKADE